MKNIKFVELFAGIGGFRYGLESINRNKNRRSQENSQGNAKKGQGLQSTKREKNCNQERQYNEQSNSNTNSRTFTCIWANEWDKYAVKIYKKNFGEKPDTRDIRTVEANEIPNHDLLTAGFPCQAFSIAGHRKGFEDTRGTLFFDIARILNTKRPRYLLLENVRGLLSHDKGRTFKIILSTLDELGYDLQWQVLNSKNFGVPQNRERVFIIGHIRGTSRPKIFPIKESNTNVKRLEYYQKADKEIARIYEVEGLAPTLHVKTGGWQEPKIRLKNLKDKSDIGVTLSATSYKGYGNDGVTLIEQEMRVRKLTPIECERLQGFPDNWTEGISDTQRYKCLGNAVTTNVITEIGKRLIKINEK